MKKYIVKHSLSCDELGLKQVGDSIETNNEELVARLGNLIEEVKETIEIKENIEENKNEEPYQIKPVGENEGNDLPTSNNVDLDTKTIEELIIIAKEKGIKGNLKAYKEETLKEKIREIK